jgi:hypothetical protein
MSGRHQAFQQGLSDLGYVEGKKSGQADRSDDSAEVLVRADRVIR